jgi:hypothetical protein
MCVGERLHIVYQHFTKTGSTYCEKYYNTIILVVSSSVTIATDYGLEGPGMESRWGGEIFCTCPDPHSLLYNGYRVNSGSRKRPGSDADPSPPSSAQV